MIEKFKDNKALNQEELVLYWRENPVIAAKDILGVKLDRHQQIVLNARWKSDTQIDILSRGTGKTFLNGVFAVLRAMLIPAHKVGLIAPSFRQSKMMFAEIEKLYQKSPMMQEAVDRKPVRSADSCTLKFLAAPGYSSSIIEALPLGVDGAKIRGARYYDVIADEGAQIDDNTLDIVVRGFLATSSDPMARVEYMEEQMRRVEAGEITMADVNLPENNKLIISSTAFYQYNHLWRRVGKIIKDILAEKKQLERDGKSTDHIVMKGGALNGGQIPARIVSNGKLTLTAFTYKDPSPYFMNLQTIEEAKRDMSDYMFRMEYEAYFPPDSEGFYRRSDLEKCRLHGEFSCLSEPRKGRFIYTMGIDPARTNDNFAISIWEVDLDSGTCNLVRVMSWNKKNFQVMHQEVRKLIQLYGITYFEMDGGGGGTTVRDLLADQMSCPMGQKLILEEEFEEHKALIGQRLLGPLIQFSNYAWVHDANHNLLSAIQHGRVKIAAKPGAGSVLWTPIAEEMDMELEEALIEVSSIVVSSTGDRMRWDTPTDSQRKDRYSAILIGHSAALKVAARHLRPRKPVDGGWA
jgi:hypothetical protein